MSPLWGLGLWGFGVAINHVAPLGLRQSVFPAFFVTYHASRITLAHVAPPR